MQTILSALHLLKKARETAPTTETRAAQDQYAELIRNSVQQLIAIGETILPCTPASEREPVRLSALTQRTLRLLRDLAALESVAFELEVDAAATTELPANKDDLQLALTALLFGIVERAPPDSTAKISIARTEASLRWRARVAAHPSRPNPDWTLFAGAGGEDAPGADLGWSVAREIAVEHGGRMTLEDAGRDGWTLELALPAAAHVPS
jgi:signal transduction histidine kinase